MYEVGRHHLNQAVALKVKADFGHAEAGLLGNLWGCRDADVKLG